MRPRALLLRVAAGVVLLAALAQPARAQLPDPGQGVPETPAAGSDPVVAPGPRVSVRQVRCGGSQAEGLEPIDTTPGAFAAPASSGPVVPWNDFTVVGVGPLLDPAATVHDLVEPAFKKLQTASEPERSLGIAAAVAQYGYQLDHVEIRTTPATVSAVFHLARLPIVRKVAIEIKDRSVGEALSTATLDEEVRRRVQIKPGAYLPFRDDARQCKLTEEKVRIEDYLHDEGYYDATVKVKQAGATDGVPVRVEVHLGASYQIGRITIDPPTGLDLPDAAIKKVFQHYATCLLGKSFEPACWGTGRFTRSQHQEDLQKVTELFHKKGFPSARVTSDYTPTGSFDRRTHTVNFKVSIDQRRRLEVLFDGLEGDDAGISNDELRAQLTFDQAGSADDVEAANSARALALYLQKRGHFEARVTWSRERVAVNGGEGFDQLRFRIDLGPTRNVEEVDFQGVKAIDEDALRELVYTKANGLAGTLFGTNASATSEELAADVERIVQAYRRQGYRDARVQVAAAPVPQAMDSAALTAALVSADRGDGLYVQFAVTEGSPTLLTRVEIAIDGDPGLCEPLLGKLGELLGTKLPARASGGAPGAACVAVLPRLLFKEDDVQRTSEALRDYLWNKGRSRASVDYRWDVDGPHQVVARYQVRRVDPLKIGKIVIRGNFVTRDSVIRDDHGNGELQLIEGKALTADDLAQATQRLRATGLFDAVNVVLPNLCSTPDPACVASSDLVNAVVMVQERYDFTAQVDISGGYSSYSGLFGTVGPAQRNLFGTGLYGEGSVTYGTKIFSIDGTLRVPKWLMRRAWVFDDLPVYIRNFLQTELTGFIRNQDTPNFGKVETKGVSLALTYAPTPRPRSTVTKRAQSLIVGLHYDFRLRGRNVDALRPIGVDSDQSQVPISTYTGSVGLTLDWDRRVDRHGALSPLSPEDGFRLNAGVSIASKYLLGQDEFAKITASGTKYWPVGKNLVVRADLRYDQGIPLFGAVLLPEVERFFAGGDSTVRGYDDDKLRTEIVEVGVPPLGNVQQLRILPSGGNIRAMGSLDAQLHVYSVFATAVFTDAGLITNQWSTVTGHDIRPSVGMALLRAVTPFGTLAIEYAVPLLPHLGDDPRGRFHISFAARAQF